MHDAFSVTAIDCVRPFLRWGHAVVVILLLCACFCLCSCHTSRHGTVGSPDYRQLARAGLALGFDIDMEDDWALFTESASWLGTPYRYGGNTRAGVDCSGLTSQVFRNVYGKSLHRKSADQYAKDCRSVSGRNLRSGDLVFFSSSGKKRDIDHVGIYLKDQRFIHASSSRGVVVSGLGESYYQKHWVSGGRVK